MTLTTTAKATEEEMAFADAVGSRRWVLGDRPFRHVMAHDVFRPGAYERVVGDFRAYLADESRLRYADVHDFFGAPLTPPLPPGLALFLSREFLDVFAQIFGVPSTGHATGGVHRHRAGSRNGFPHNDIAPESLAEAHRPDEIFDLTHGDHPDGQSVRAVAVLFYLNNGEWHPGDGGGTGLYEHWSDPVSRPVAMAPPRDNSLLAFECTPYSYHSFIGNRNRRDSVIVFLYRSLTGYLEQWGMDGLTQFAEVQGR